MTEKIDRFMGENRWLSNFEMAELEYEGHIYPSSEHLYQALKTVDPAERQQIREAKKPGEAKKLGRLVTMRPDWEDIKFDVMFSVVRQKFTRHQYLKEKLLATKDAYLEEANTWGDKVWGTVNGQGKNWLGIILMEVRKELGGFGNPREVGFTCCDVVRDVEDELRDLKALSALLGPWKPGPGECDGCGGADLDVSGKCSACGFENPGKTQSGTQRNLF